MLKQFFRSIAAASNDTELLTFSVDEPDYLSVFSHSDVLESLFQVSIASRQKEQIQLRQQRNQRLK